MSNLNKNENHQIEIYSIKLFAKLIKASLNSIDKENMLKKIESEYYSSNSYYKRRIYVYFFEELLETFSIQFLTEFKVIFLAIPLLKDKFLFPLKLINILTKYIPVFEYYKIYMKDEIYQTIKQLKSQKDISQEILKVKLFLK